MFTKQPEANIISAKMSLATKYLKTTLLFDFTNNKHTQKITKEAPTLSHYIYRMYCMSQSINYKIVKIYI